MGNYVLVNEKDEKRELRISEDNWVKLLSLLQGAGWQPMGATGHQDLDMNTLLHVPLDTAADRIQSYTGCLLQTVSEEDAKAMLVAALYGMSMCETKPNETFDFWHHVEHREIRAAMVTPEALEEATREVRVRLLWFAEFAVHGAFFID